MLHLHDYSNILCDLKDIINDNNEILFILLSMKAKAH